MERIQQALERARSVHSIVPAPAQIGSSWHRADSPVGERSGTGNSAVAEAELSRRRLQAKRIVAHDSSDPNARFFDILRTQVLRLMDQKGWRVLAVTSPTQGCGKTLTSINLALSIARQPERTVLLADLDLRKPDIANCLGLKCKSGIMDVLQAQSTLHNALVQARIDGHRLLVLPNDTSTSKASDWMSSRAMADIFQNLKKDHESRIVIVDMPPILTSDDVIAALPHVDCVLLVAAIGVSTVAEIEESGKHLHSANVVRVVVNKTPEPAAKYYY